MPAQTDNTLALLLIFSLAFCGVTFLLVVLAVIVAIRQLQRFTAPNIDNMRRKLAQLRAANPGATDQALIQTIIRQQSFKCGIVGAITGIGGFFTLPVALPVDILVSMRLQATMVQFIALVYGQVSPDNQDLKLQTYLVMSGGVEVAENTFDIIMRIIARILGYTLGDLIPFIGAGVGFAVNYFMAQAVGNVALRWYSSRRLPQPDRGMLPG